MKKILALCLALVLLTGCGTTSSESGISSEAAMSMGRRMSELSDVLDEISDARVTNYDEKKDHYYDRVQVYEKINDKYDIEELCEAGKSGTWDDDMKEAWNDFYDKALSDAKTVDSSIREEFPSTDVRITIWSRETGNLIILENGEITFDITEKFEES